MEDELYHNEPQDAASFTVVLHCGKAADFVLMFWDRDTLVC